jgi:hypothetical protein
MAVWIMSNPGQSKWIKVVFRELGTDFTVLRSRNQKAFLKRRGRGDRREKAAQKSTQDAKSLKVSSAETQSRFDRLKALSAIEGVGRTRGSHKSCE